MVQVESGPLSQYRSYRATHGSQRLEKLLLKTEPGLLAAWGTKKQLEQSSCFLVDITEHSVYTYRNTKVCSLPKLLEKIRVIELRRHGKTYSEILSEIKVSKSTLTLWLKEVGLSKSQKQRITKKRRAAMERGWTKIHQTRLLREQKIKTLAKNEVASLLSDPLWIAGLALYWAEGSKQKEYLVSQGVNFSNSDPVMIKLILQWFIKKLNIQKTDLYFELYIHETHRHRVPEVVHFWANIVNSPPTELRTYFKKGEVKTLRKNTGNNYFGVLRVRVRKSTDLNRRIAGWVEGISKMLV